MDKNESNQTEGITNMVTKDNSKKRKDILQSAGTIIGVILFAFILSFICSKVMVEDVDSELTIGRSSAEVDLYNADYEGAVSEYELEKENTEWPMYKVEEAQVYSIKGDYTYSNRLLSEAYDKRNELIRKNTIEKYEEEDKKLGNLMTFTALMNGDIEKALEYGEIFLLDHEGGNNELEKIMFSAYLANGNTTDAEEMLKEIEWNHESAYELAEAAYMNMILGKYSEGIDYLKEAYAVDKNEIKIYDVLQDISTYNSRELIDELKKLNENNPDEICYKIWLARCYALNSSSANDAQKLLDEIKNKDVASTPYNLIQSDVYKALGEVDKYNETIEEIINLEEDNYFGQYIAARYAYENKEYSKGIEYAKNSILNNREYVNTYAVIMPELLYASKEGEKAESYFRTALYEEPFNLNIIANLADYSKDVLLDAEKAVKYYNLALAFDKDNSEIYYELGCVKETLDKKEEAVSLLEKAVSLNSKEPKYYRKIASIYLEERENEKAIKAIRKAYDINNDDINTLNDAGYYYISVEEIDRALTNFKAAYEEMNDSTELNVREVVTKNYEKAKEYSEKKVVWSKSSVEDFKYLD